MRNIRCETRQTIQVSAVVFFVVPVTSAGPDLFPLFVRSRNALTLLTGLVPALVLRVSSYFSILC